VAAGEIVALIVSIAHATIGEMKTKGRTTGTVAITLAAVTLLLGSYFAAYFLCCRARTIVGIQAQQDMVVMFSRHWQANLFKPAAAIESFLRGRNVETFSQEAMDAL
jgi:hypothetical protein